jgi:hypothetical protein
MERFYLRTTTQEEFDNASDYKAIVGFISGKCCSIKGRQVPDLSRHKDPNTTYKKFVGCSICVSSDEFSARQRKCFASFDGPETVWIFPP